MLRISQRGFGIPELLIGIAVGMIIVGAAVQMLFTTLQNSNDNIKMARLDQDLRQTMQMVSRDLRRASAWDPMVDVARVAMQAPLLLSSNTGSVSVTSSTIGALASIGSNAVGSTLIHVDSDGNVWQGAITAYNSGTYTVTLTGTWPDTVDEDNLSTNAVSDGISAGSWTILRPQASVTIADATGDGTTDCALFTYDLDLDGAFGSSEYLGYRYDDDNLAVETRYSGASGNTCTTGGSWEDITDPNVVQVTSFSIADASPADVSSSGMYLGVRQYTITISGRLAADTSVIRTMQETIRVRNDNICMATPCN